MNLTISLLFLGCLHVSAGVASTPSPTANDMTTNNSQLSRKRIHQIGKPKIGSNDFGKHVASSESEREIFREINWNRILEETSFTKEPQCKFKLELDCYLANDRHVSFDA